MQTRFLYTLADPSQFEGLFNGLFLKGHREPRIAMVGRSNVGKSTLINLLLKQTLARTSSEPGKTRAIHFYFWSQAKKIIADLPGYGYARASKDDRTKWETFIKVYFEQEQNLDRILMLLDSRHGPTELDQGAIEFFSSRDIPVSFVLTKVDTLKTQSERALRKREVTEALSRLGYEDEPIYWVSSRTKSGLGDLVKSLCHNHEKEN